MNGEIPTSTPTKNAHYDIPPRFIIYGNRADRTRDEKHEQNGAASKRENRWIKRNALATTGATIGIMLFTAAAVGVSFYQWRALRSSDEAIREQLVEMRIENRAWISPEQIVAPENFQEHKDEDAAIGLRFQNTGKEPAFDLNNLMGVDVIDGPKWRDNDFMRGKVRDMLGGGSCDDLGTSSDGRTIFPGQHAGFLMDLDHEKALRGSTDPNYLVMVVSCFAYQTTTGVHRSQFCGVLGHPNRSNDNKWQTIFCGVNNRAD
jgi:hypothetical protein